MKKFVAVSLILVLAVIFWKIDALHFMNQSAAVEGSNKKRSISEDRRETGLTVEAGEETSQLQLEEEPDRQLLGNEHARVVVLGEGAIPIKEGTLYAVQVNSKVIDLIETDFSADYWKLSAATDVLEFELNNLDISPVDLITDEEAFVWIDSPGYFAELDFVKRGELDLRENLQFKLKPALPVQINVADDKGDPMSGIGVYCWAIGKDTEYVSQSWRDRLKKNFYVTYEKTEADGVAKFLSPVDWSMSFTSARIAGYSTGSVLDGWAGNTYDMILYPGARITGRVLDETLQPVPKSYVYFISRAGTDFHETLGAATVGEDGKYEIPEVSTKADFAVGIAIAEGYSTSFKTLSHFTSTQEYEIDFELRKGTPLEFFVCMKDGTPISNMQISFGQDSFDWVPGQYRTDEQGFFWAKGHIEADTEYLVYFDAGETEMPPVALKTPALAGERVPIVLPDLGLYESVDIKVRQGEIEPSFEFLQFHFSCGGRTFVAEWRFGEPTPWLPAQAGRMKALSAEGWTTTVPFVVEKGKHESIVVDFPFAKLEFELPKRADAQKWRVSIDGATTGKDQAWSLEGGLHESWIGPGEITVKVEDPNGIAAVYGPYFLDENGLDLGLLDRSYESQVFGRVITVDGESWENIRVWLIGKEGWNDQCLTDSEGRYRFDHVAPGHYRVEVAPFDSHFVNVPNVSEEIDVGLQKNLGPLNFTIDAQHLLRGMLAPAFKPHSQAVLVEANRMQRTLIAATGHFVFQAPNEESIVLAYGVQDGELHVLGRSLPEGHQSISLSSGSGVRKKIRFKNASGTALAHAQIDVFFSRHHFVTHHTDAKGDFTCKVSPEVPLVLRIHHQKSPSDRISLNALPSQGEFIVGNDGRRVLLVTQDIDGRGLSTVSLLVPELGWDGMTTAQGEISLPATAVAYPVVVERAGYWPIRKILTGAHPITLRKTVETAEIPRIAALTNARVEMSPMFDLGYSLTIQPSPSQGSWTISGVPEGRYALKGTDQDGGVVYQGVVFLRAGRPPVIE